MKTTIITVIAVDTLTFRPVASGTEVTDTAEFTFKGLSRIATAAIGGVAADPGSAWYRSLRKPRWQPPPPAYALVWMPLYATIANAGARAVNRARSRDRS
jgi:translocator protein